MSLFASDMYISICTSRLHVSQMVIQCINQRCWHKSIFCPFFPLCYCNASWLDSSCPSLGLWQTLHFLFYWSNMNHRNGVTRNENLCFQQWQHLVQYLTSKSLRGFPTSLSRRKEKEARNSHRIKFTLRRAVGQSGILCRQQSAPQVSWTDWHRKLVVSNI